MSTPASRPGLHDDRDPSSPQRVRRATGTLAAFNVAGVLGAADVHVAQRLGRLGGERDEAVLLAAALVVRGLRGGSVCLDVPTAARTTAVEGVEPAAVEALPWPDPAAWVGSLAASVLVGVGPEGAADRPLRLVDGLLYLDRYWRQERCIAEVLDEAAARPQPQVDTARLQAALRRLFPAPEPDRQRLAAVLAAHRWVSVLAGGPGTGKTTTVAKLLAVLADQPGATPRIALAAPTGKAAARLTEAVAGVSDTALSVADRERLGPLTASTLHRLLGWRPGARGRFRHDRYNRLPYDVVVVDEASMVSLTLMARLAEALRPDCRLVLVGDPDQLASVEAGAVLGDLVAREASLADVPAGAQQLPALDLDDLTADERTAAVHGGVVRLARVHRFSGGIKDLAEAVRAGRTDEVLAVLAAAPPGVEHVDVDAASTGDVASGPADGRTSSAAGDRTGTPAGAPVGAPVGDGGADPVAGLRREAVAAGAAVVAAARAGDAVGALAALERQRLLCAHREGGYGVQGWSDRIESWLRDGVAGYAAEGRWYVGRPLLVTANDYQLRLFNGDTGVVVVVDGAVRAAFRRDGVVDLVPVSRLSDVQTVHAMSVHRSQGSQFDRVTLVLPPADSPLLTRELLYTAITRAKEHVRVVGTGAALTAAVERPIARASGLRARP